MVGELVGEVCIKGFLVKRFVSFSVFSRYLVSFGITYILSETNWSATMWQLLFVRG